MKRPIHINSAFDQDLKELNVGMKDLADLSKKQFLDVITILENSNFSTLDDLIKRDKKVDNLEIALNEKALEVIALRSPMAEDLRHVIVVLKIAAILERVGDHAKNIAKRSKIIFADDNVIIPISGIVYMGRRVYEMLHKVLQAYTENDAVMAMEVWGQDVQIDQLHADVFKDLLKKLAQDSEQIEIFSHLLFVSKNLERVGDYATGIAEQIYFLVTGKTLEDERPKTDFSGHVS